MDCIFKQDNGSKLLFPRNWQTINFTLVRQFLWRGKLFTSYWIKHFKLFDLKLITLTDFHVIHKKVQLKKNKFKLRFTARAECKVDQIYHLAT